MEVPSPEPPAPSCPHLLPALAAVLVVLLASGGIEAFVRLRLAARMDRFALTMPPVKLTGNVLQSAAFRTPDILPIYGSSELDRPAENRPDTFFCERPTGFMAFPIGRAGNTCLIILEKLAATGEAARGKKVAIFLSPSWFLRDAGADAVDSNLRPLQLGTWVFGHTLSEPLKRDIARRLLGYPQTLDKQPLLALALESLAGEQRSTFDRVRLALLEPFGHLQNLFLERTEYWAILRDLPTLLPSRRQREQSRRRVDLAAPTTTTPDWAKLAGDAEAHDRALGNASLYSVGVPAADLERHHGGKSVSDSDAGHSAKWSQREAAGSSGWAVSAKRDAEFDSKLMKSGEWTDLSLLLRVLRELDTDALIISQPFNGLYRDLGGNSPGARRAYYQRLGEVVGKAGFDLRDFSEHEEDKYFFNDAGHPSAKAWIYYDHALDDFYHETRAEHKS